MNCPTCKTKMRETITTGTIHIGRFRVDGPLAEWVCPRGHEGLVDGATLGRLELDAAVAVLREAKDIEGAELKAIRKCMGMSQRQLGDLLGRTVETLSRQENDALVMSRADRLALLAIALGVRETGDPDAFIEQQAKRSNRRTLRVAS